MAALFAKRVPRGASSLQQRNPEALVGQANSRSLQAPSYSPPQGQIMTFRTRAWAEPGGVTGD